MEKVFSFPRATPVPCVAGRSLSSRQARRRRITGFTLVEIMLVMVILSLFTGVVLTNMRAAYLSILFESDTEGLSDAIVCAQEYARAKRCVCRLNVDTENQTYFFSAAYGSDLAFSPVAGALGEPVLLSKGITFAEVRKVRPDRERRDGIHFFPDGRAEHAYITLNAGEDDERIIEIQPLFGPPQIE